MLIIEFVQGEKEQALPVVKTTHTIFIHENIEEYVNPINNDNSNDMFQSSNVELFEYKEYQLDLIEYEVLLDRYNNIKSKKDTINNYEYPIKNILEIMLDNGDLL